MSHRENRLRPGRFIAQAAAALAFLAWLPSASADVLFEKPEYNPHTKSYFMLVHVRVEDFDRGKDGNDWSSAQKNAQERVFHGVHGRLAVVRDLDTTAWVESTFQPPGETWIGLQYICAERQLQWTDGTYSKPGDFHLWTTNWFQSDGVPCSSNENLPVELYKDRSGVHWAAKGAPKAFNYYLVEFPTGQP